MVSLQSYNTRSISTTAATSNVTVMPIRAQGERGEQGLPGPGAAAWAPADPVTTGTVRQAPDGSRIKSLASRTTRATFDATEQTFWKSVAATPGTIEATDLAATTAASIQAGQTDPQVAVDARVNAGSQSVKTRQRAAVRRARKRTGSKYALPTNPTIGTTNGAMSVAGGAIVTITANTLAAALPAGVITVDDGVHVPQWFYTTGAALGATSIPVLSTAPWADHGSGATIKRGFRGANLPINLFYDGGSFSTDFDAAKFRNKGTSISTGGLTTGISRGATVTSIGVTTIAAVTKGDTIVVSSGSTYQMFLASADAISGATSISVAPTVALTAVPPTSLAAFPLAGSVYAQGFYFVDPINGVSSNSGRAVATLSGPLTPGAAITSIPVNAIPLAISSGRSVVIFDGLNSMTATLSSGASVNATSLVVNSVTPNAVYPASSMAVSPKNTMNGAYTAAAAGDEIRLLDRASNVNGGIEHRNSGTLGNSSQKVLKSLNIVGHFPGEAKTAAGDALTWTQDGTYPNVWHATRSGVQKVVDIAHPASRQGIAYTLQTSVAAVAAAPGSWYLSGSDIAVSTTDGTAPDNSRHLALINAYNFWVDNTSGQVDLYLADLTIIGGIYGAVRASQTNSGNAPNLYMKNVRGLWGAGTDTHANMVNFEAGGVCYSQDCLMMGGEKDGWNYTGAIFSGITYASRFIEVDCTGHSLGLSRVIAGDTNNVTTAHSGAYGIRVKTVGYYTAGVPIADVQIGTQSVNLECEGYDSMSQTNSVSAALSAQQAGTEMWVIGGRYFAGDMVPGVTPIGDIQAAANTTVHLVNAPEYDNGSGTFTTAA